MKKIAIIGGGISGLYIANLLKKNPDYEITVFEKNDFLNTKNKPKNGLWVKKTELKNYMIPTFTKKIFASVKHNL